MSPRIATPKSNKRATKRRVRRAAPTPLAVLSALLPALSAYYTDSYLAPGIVIAYLPEKGRFYASIARYPRGQGRVVHNRIFADSLEELIIGMAKGWYNRPQPMVTLGKLLHGIMDDGRPVGSPYYGQD